MYHFAFESKDLMGIKYCPNCGGEVMTPYPGDYMGHIQCHDCEWEVDFIIVQEVITRFPDRWKDIFFKKGENGH